MLSGRKRPQTRSASAFHHCTVCHAYIFHQEKTVNEQRIFGDQQARLDRRKLQEIVTSPGYLLQHRIILEVLQDVDDKQTFNSRG